MYRVHLLKQQIEGQLYKLKQYRNSFTDLGDPSLAEAADTDAQELQDQLDQARTVSDLLNRLVDVSGLLGSWLQHLTAQQQQQRHPTQPDAPKPSSVTRQLDKQLEVRW